MCFPNRFTLYWLALNDLLALPADLSTVRKRIGQASWWVNETPSEAGGSCALFIHFEHSWQPAQTLMQRKRGRNRKWSCNVSLFHKTVLWSWVYCQHACSWGSQGSRGWGRWGRRKMNGERGFVLKLCRIGKVFICVRRCLYRISHSVHTAFYEVNVNVRESCQAIHQQLESCQQDRDRWHLSSTKLWHPLTSGLRSCCSKTIQIRVVFQSCLACRMCPQPSRSTFPSNQGVWSLHNMATVHKTADRKIA